MLLTVTKAEVTIAPFGWVANIFHNILVTFLLRSSNALAVYRPLKQTKGKP